MNILLIYPPARITHKADSIPFGLSYVAASLIKGNNHQVNILDINAHRHDVQEVIQKITSIKFDIIGIGGITTTYSYIKWLVLLLKERYPSIPIIVGGYVASVSEFLLKKVGVDIVVTGEGEVTMRKIVDAYEREGDIFSIDGIAYKVGNSIIYNKPENLIRPLDSIPIPAYHLLPMDKYLLNAEDDESYLSDKRVKKFIKQGKKLFGIMTGRGCFAKCTFCYRHIKGIRQHSVEYVIEHIKYLQEAYNVGLFTFHDDLFTLNRKWLNLFCEKLKEGNIDILFKIGGARVDTIDKEILKQLKDSGCVSISYGFESGSQKMLDIMNKHTTVEINKRAALMTKEAGLGTIPQIIIGMPGETNETIQETIEFLTECDYYDVSTNFATAFPGTKLYEDAKKKGLVKDEENYIMNLNENCEFRLNFTEESDSVVQYWRYKVNNEVKKRYLKKHRYFGTMIFFLIQMRNFINYLQSVGIRRSFNKVGRLLFASFRNKIGFRCQR